MTEMLQQIFQISKSIVQVTLKKKSAKGTSNSDNIASLQTNIENNKVNVANINSVENT